MNKLQKRELITAASFFMLAVALGAFAAYGLKSLLTEKGMATYQTGVQYQFLLSVIRDLPLITPMMKMN
jgi:uncharacterized membrane protein YgdD (TMEM256/DUF423 family)